MLQRILLFFSFISELLKSFFSLERNMEHIHRQGIQGLHSEPGPSKLITHVGRDNCYLVACTTGTSSLNH